MQINLSRIESRKTIHQSKSHNRRSGFSSLAEIAGGMGLRLPQPPRYSQSIKTIHEAGGRMVLLQNWPSSDRRAKEPLPGIPWAKYRPPLDVLLSHPGRVGIIPASLHSTALDVDRGDPHFLPMGWVEYPSRRPGGKHLWYQETQQFKDCHWESKGCSGDVRSKGYLIPWNNGISRIAKALVEGRQLSLFPFPAEMLRAAVQGHGVELHRPGLQHGLPPVARSLWYPGMDLEDVQVGARYVAHFDTLRKWAYTQTRGTDLAYWKGMVLEQGFIENERFPKPFRGNELRLIKDNSYSVACWTWSHMLDYGRYRTTSMQTARGISSGASRRVGSNEELRPWEDQSISRRTWYRHKANGTRTESVGFRGSAPDLSESIGLKG